MALDLMKPVWASKEITEAAKAHAMRDYPNEACGIVTRSQGYVPCENLAYDKVADFEMDPVVWITHKDILGIIHSHTNSNYAPSASDMKHQIASGLAWGIIVSSGDSASEVVWWGGDTPVAPLLGRTFIHGIHDCYSLIRDWYKVERGITLKDFPRNNMWWEAGEALYSQFSDAGFYQIPNDPMGIQPGDVFIARVRSVVDNHGGLYIGDGLVLHHVGGHYSLTSPAGAWIKLVTKWVRYGEKP